MGLKQQIEMKELTEYITEYISSGRRKRAKDITVNSTADELSKWLKSMGMKEMTEKDFFRDDAKKDNSFCNVTDSDFWKSPEIVLFTVNNGKKNYFEIIYDNERNKRIGIIIVYDGMDIIMTGEKPEKKLEFLKKCVGWENT
jgi:hypothetical protein